MHTDYSPPPSALHIIGNQSPLSFHLEANAFKAIKLWTIYLNLKEPNETSLQDEIDFALWLSCTCDTLGNVNFSISDWRSVFPGCAMRRCHTEVKMLLRWSWKWKWHTAKYGDPYSEFVHCIYPSKCTHTAVNTHTPWTHTRSSGQPLMLRHPETRTHNFWITSSTLYH